MKKTQRSLMLSAAAQSWPGNGCSQNLNAAGGVTEFYQAFDFPMGRAPQTTETAPPQGTTHLRAARRLLAIRIRFHDSLATANPQAVACFHLAASWLSCPYGVTVHSGRALEHR